MLLIQVIHIYIYIYGIDKFYWMINISKIPLDAMSDAMSDSSLSL